MLNIQLSDMAIIRNKVFEIHWNLLFTMLTKMSSSKASKNSLHRVVVSVSLLLLPINLMACGESANSRMPGEHRELFTNTLSSYSLDFVESVQECNALPEVTTVGGSGNGFSGHHEVVPGTLQLSSYEKWEESTMIGEIEVIQASYSGRYNLTCEGQGGSGAQEQGRVTTGEQCLTGYLSFYKQRGMQNYEPYEGEITDRSC